MNFRRVLTALAVMALFTSLASAQIILPGAMTCAVTASSAPSLRAEGKTDLVGDVLVRCTGGIAPTNRALPVPAVDITVDYGVPVNSRQATTGGKIYTDALLVLDDPNSTAAPVVAGFGNGAPLGVCGTIPAAGKADTSFSCPTYAVRQLGINAVNYETASSVAPPGAPLAAVNAYQGLLNAAGGSKVTFYAVPLVAPVDAGVYRQYRIVNVRVPAGSASIVATVTPSGPNAGLMNITGNTTATVGAGATGFTTSLTAGNGTADVAQIFSQCIAPDLASASPTVKPNVALLNFKEAFANAAKPQAPAPAALTTYGNYNTESGIILASGALLNVATVAPYQPGLADAGTRFKAVFSGLPKNANIFVSQSNVKNFVENAPAGILATLSKDGEADFYTAPGAPDITPNPGVAPAVGNAATKLTVDSTGKATAVWEVFTTDSTKAETFSFAVYIQYNGTPALTNATVTLSVAPVSPASTDEVQIPQFSTSGNATPVLTTVPCQTSLLFPFVSNQQGYETGIAISNTSMDPFGTTNSAGTCALNFYGDNAPTSASSIDSVAAGKVYTNTLGQLGLVNFNGYMVAVCNFQYAHGFAFIVSPNNATMGYLALVLSDTTRGQFLAGEALGL